MKLFMTITELAKEVGPYDRQTIYNLKAQNKLKLGVHYFERKGSPQPIIFVPAYIDFLRGLPPRPFQI